MEGNGRPAGLSVWLKQGAGRGALGPDRSWHRRPERRWWLALSLLLATASAIVQDIVPLPERLP